MMKSGLLILMTLLLAGGCTVAPIAPTAAPAPARRDEVRIFTDLVNEHRKKVGCRPLVWLDQVARIAQRHSEDMAFHQFFSHTNLQGESPFERLKNAGITFRNAAENIAEGQRSAEEVMQGWLGSSGHRRNIEDCGLAQHGVGMYQNRWTHMFVTVR
jgi:uncharacterized protein YkwD